MRNVGLLFLIVLLVMPLTSITAHAAPGDRAAQKAEVKKEYHRLIDSFFTLLGQHKSGSALDYIYDTNLNLDNIKAQVAEKRVRFIADMERFGPFQQHAIVLEREYAGLYAYLYVIAVCDFQPVKMEFHFYKPKQRWRLYSFTYSRHLDQDIADILKYELITGADGDRKE